VHDRLAPQSVAALDGLLASASPAAEPPHAALVELKAVCTVFLCRYLASEALRREIHSHVNPDGVFRLDLNTRLPIEDAA
jgi:TnpA family transposase